jgi:hypothetical protein
MDNTVMSIESTPIVKHPANRDPVFVNYRYLLTAQPTSGPTIQIESSAGLVTGSSHSSGSSFNFLQGQFNEDGPEKSFNVSIIGPVARACDEQQGACCTLEQKNSAVGFEQSCVAGFESPVMMTVSNNPNCSSERDFTVRHGPDTTTTCLMLRGYAPMIYGASWLVSGKVPNSAISEHFNFLRLRWPGDTLSETTFGSLSGDTLLPEKEMLNRIRKEARAYPKWNLATPAQQFNAIDII